MLLDAQGVILATSSGTMTRDLTDGTDFLSAQTSASGKGHDIFTTPQGERVMAVTELVPYAAGNVAAMRLVTSLTLVDRQWWNTVTAATGVGVLVLVFTIWSGLFFVRSIVRPLGEIEATATKLQKAICRCACRTTGITTRWAACARPSTRWPRTWPRPSG